MIFVRWNAQGGTVRSQRADLGRRHRNGRTFGLEPAKLADFLEQRELILQQDAGASDYRARYYGAAAQRMPGDERYRIEVGEVAA